MIANYRRRYALMFLFGLCLTIWSAIADFNPLAFVAGLFLGSAVVAFDREVKRTGPQKGSK